MGFASLLRLCAENVSVANEAEGLVRSKREAIHRLAELLAHSTQSVGADEIEQVLGDRERLQSTGVGGGVAIPHGNVERLDRLVGAVLLCPSPIDFDAIDAAPVSILVAVVGPKRSAGEHLKMLARVSRVLRDEGFRSRLLAAKSGVVAYQLIAAEEGGIATP